jgi:hypothetical protein
VTTLDILSKEWLLVRELFNLTWPLSNRDCIMLRKLQYNENSDMNTKAEDCCYMVEVPVVHPKCPPVKGIVRVEPGNINPIQSPKFINYLEIAFIIRRKDSQICHITGLCYSDMKIPRVPKSFLNFMTKSSFPIMVKNMQLVLRLLNCGKIS